MKPIQRVFLLVLPLSLTAFSYAEVPSWIDAKMPGQSPTWVSASEALPDGAPRLEIFDENARQSLESHFETLPRALEARNTSPSETECLTWAFLGHPSPDHSLTLRAQHGRSWQIFGGTITDFEYGFFQGYPAMLLELAIDRTFKRAQNASGTTPPSLYFVFRHAEIPTEYGLMCTRSRRYPDLPRKNSRAVVFAHEPLLAENSFIVNGAEDDIFFERADGTVSAPEFFEDQTKRFEHITEAVVELDSENNQ